MAATARRPGAAAPGGRLAAGDFFGEVVSRRRDPDLALSEIVHARAWQLPRHGHAAAGVCLLLGGGYREWVARRELEVRPGDAVYHPSDYLHRDEVAPGGARFFFVELSGALAGRLEGALPRGPVLDRGGRAATAARRLRRELAGDDPGSVLIREGLACELVGALLRRSLGEAEGTPAWVARADALLRERLAEGWSLSVLAAAAGVAPARLARGFRRAFGESVGERLRRLRVEAVHDRLARPGTDLAEVAFACGFADQSHMTRAFRAAYGATPGQVRARSAYGGR